VGLVCGERITGGWRRLLPGSGMMKSGRGWRISSCTIRRILLRDGFVMAARRDAFPLVTDGGGRQREYEYEYVYEYAQESEWCGQATLSMRPPGRPPPGPPF
jgi:hypothetical protein